jgi:hypothetical protein
MPGKQPVHTYILRMLVLRHRIYIPTHILHCPALKQCVLDPDLCHLQHCFKTLCSLAGFVDCDWVKVTLDVRSFLFVLEPSSLPVSFCIFAYLPCTNLLSRLIYTSKTIAVAYGLTHLVNDQALHHEVPAECELPQHLWIAKPIHKLFNLCATSVWQIVFLLTAAHCL